MTQATSVKIKCGTQAGCSSCDFRTRDEGWSLTMNALRRCDYYMGYDHKFVLMEGIKHD